MALRFMEANGYNATKVVIPAAGMSNPEILQNALAEKEIERFEMMLKDCRTYEKTLFTVATQKIELDLGDGVKVNYQKFKEVLVGIKGLEAEE